LTTKKIILVTIIVTLTSCGLNEKSREKFEFSHKLNKELTVETFNVFGQGAWGADLYGQWLTDSINFRIFIGTCDYENTRIIVDLKGDTMLINKKDNNNIIENHTYRTSELKNNKTHDD
jgi:hypothetical protein